MPSLRETLEKKQVRPTEPGDQPSVTGTAAAGDGHSYPQVHLDIVQSLIKAQRSGALPRSRLGFPGQQPRRELEHVVRRRSVEVAQQLAQQGHGTTTAARRLGLCPRTLRYWQAEARAGSRAVTALGRPQILSNTDEQQAVVNWLQDIGPGVGLPRLHGHFDSLARAELAELLQFYRRFWRVHHSRLMHVLHWQKPGTVWAMDFTAPPRPIDGLYPYVLAVRDLASGQQLLWLPVANEKCEVVLPELKLLFALHGAPLVLKMDNGSAFIAEDLRRFLEECGVLALYSPPWTPSYNGSIEASHGSLKTRTQAQADQAGHGPRWTSADADAARLGANATARPRRLKGKTPDGVWATRRFLTAEDRESFQATYQRLEKEERWNQGLAEGKLKRAPQAALDRVAISRALVAHGLLLFRRRRIPAVIRRAKVAREG